MGLTIMALHMAAMVRGEQAISSGKAVETGTRWSGLWATTDPPVRRPMAGVSLEMTTDLHIGSLIWGVTVA